MTKKIYAWANLLLILFVIAWNYYVNTGNINGQTVGELSDKYANLFTPAGYAFSIWGIIFIGLLGLGIFQVRRAYQTTVDNNFVTQIGPWLLLANVGNALWIWFWLQEYTGLSVLIMLVILIALTTLVIRLNIATQARERAQILWIQTPISLYAGWIAVATIANISAYLAKLNWAGLLSESAWTVVMIIIATALNAWLLWTRRMSVYAGVGAWALMAIAVRHWGQLPILAWFAAGGAALLLIGIVLQISRSKNQLVN